MAALHFSFGVATLGCFVDFLLLVKIFAQRKLHPSLATQSRKPHLGSPTTTHKKAPIPPAPSQHPTYTGGAANSPPSPRTSQAHIGSDGCKPENRDILSDFSESHFCPAKVLKKRWQAPIGSPFTSALGLLRWAASRRFFTAREPALPIQSRKLLLVSPPSHKPHPKKLILENFCKKSKFFPQKRQILHV